MKFLDELLTDTSISPIKENNNSEKLSGMLIKILKGFGIFLAIMLVLTIILAISGMISFHGSKNFSSVQMHAEIISNETE